MLIAIMVLTFVTIFILVYLTLSTFMVEKGSIDIRLKALDGLTQGRTDIDEELAKPFTQRIIKPAAKYLGAALSRFTPYSIRRMVEQRLSMAGGFGSLGVDGFLLLCGSLAIVLPLATGLITKLAGAPGNKVFGLSLISFAIGITLPFIMLNQKITARKISLQKDLPDVLDLLTVSVEAGLGFDGALAKLAEKMKGALVDEFSRVLQEMRMGVIRRDALIAMGKRCDEPDLSLFITSLVQADQLGVSIGNVLRIQSVSMRAKRKQRAEEKAMKAPIKMMLPLVLFIFPTIFIVLLGPAIIQVITTFSNR